MPTPDMFDRMSTDEIVLYFSDKIWHLKQVIQQVEWVARESDGAPVCAWCGGERFGEGHKPDCPRQKALSS